MTWPADLIEHLARAIHDRYPSHQHDMTECLFADSYRRDARSALDSLATAPEVDLWWAVTTEDSIYVGDSIDDLSREDAEALAKRVGGTVEFRACLPWQPITNP